MRSAIIRILFAAAVFMPATVARGGAAGEVTALVQNWSDSAGFDSDSGSFTETIPIAYYARIPVVAALYRLAPEHPFPAAADDAVAVYRELLKTHKPEQIAIYGTSAGAILTGEVAVRLKQSSLPEPAALGIFSGSGDFARQGDSIHLYGLRGLSGYLAPLVSAAGDRRRRIDLAVSHLRFTDLVPALRRGDVDLLITRALGVQTEFVLDTLSDDDPAAARPDDGAVVGIGGVAQHGQRGRAVGLCGQDGDEWPLHPSRSVP